MIVKPNSSFLAYLCSVYLDGICHYIMLILLILFCEFVVNLRTLYRHTTSSCVC